MYVRYRTASCFFYKLARFCRDAVFCAVMFATDYVQCDYCGRRFNESAAQRHIPWCKDKHDRLPRNKPQQASAAQKMAIRTQVSVVYHCATLNSVIICPLDIAFSMGQIIKPVCLCPCVRLRALSRSHFLMDFYRSWHRCKKPQK